MKTTGLVMKIPKFAAQETCGQTKAETTAVKKTGARTRAETIAMKSICAQEGIMTAKKLKSISVQTRAETTAMKKIGAQTKAETIAMKSTSGDKISTLDLKLFAQGI